MLVPWAGVVAYVLRRRPPAHGVPFVGLWPVGTSVATRNRRRLPPWPVVLLLLASLLAVLSAGRPHVALPDGGAVTLLVDRGIGMTAVSAGRLRYDLALDAAEARLAEAYGTGPTRLVLVPGGVSEHGTRHTAVAAARAAGPVPVDTRAAVRDATAAEAFGRSGRLLAVTDVPVDVPRVWAGVGYANAGIAYLAATQSPRPQVMVRVLGDVERGTLVVQSGGRRTEQPIDAPGEVFVDVPTLADTLSVRLLPADALRADDVAHLARRGSDVAPVATAEVPSSLRRGVEAWRRANPASATARAVRLGAGPDADVVVPGETMPTTPAGAAANTGPAPLLVRQDDERLAGVDVSRLTAIVSAGPPGDGWRALAEADGVVALALRGEQVWFAVGPAASAGVVDWLVLLGNVLESFGPGVAYVAQPTSPQRPEPGLVAGVAVNAPYVPPPDMASLGGAGQSGGPGDLAASAGVEWTSYLAAMAVALVSAAGLLAASSGRRRRASESSATVPAS